jgi:phage-related holin
VFVALVIRHAKRVCRIILLIVACPAFFLHYPINDSVFEKKKVVEYKIRFYFVYRYFSFYEELNEMILNVPKSSCKGHSCQI